METTNVLRNIKVFSIMLEETELDCQVNSNGHPIVICKKNEEPRKYMTLYSLVQELPELKEVKHLTAFAKTANFFLKGVEFQFIEDPNAYKEEYKEQVEVERNSFDILRFSLIPHGIFDVDEICAPHIEEGKEKAQVVFYVKQKIPYRVTCEFPVDSPRSQVFIRAPAL